MAKIEDNLIVDTEKIVGYAADISSDIDLVLSMTPKDGYQKKLELIVDAKDMSTKEKIEAIDAAESKYSQDLASNSEVYRDTLSLQSAILASIEEEQEEEPVVKKPTEEKPITPPAETITWLYSNTIPAVPIGRIISPIQKPKKEIKLPEVAVGDNVKHKSFGEGKIVFMDKAGKKLRVQFAIGEKMFIFPEAFTGGFLTKIE